MLNHSPVTTSHQINTLLSHLKYHTAPPEGVLFFEPLVNARLDYSPDSIKRLSQLLTQLQGFLTQKNTTLEALVSQPQSRLFFLTLAGYLGDYLAKSCDESLVWYNYFEARTEIEKKNRTHGTAFVLEPSFENSVVAKIGDNMYCQPLRAVQQHLAGQGDISEFVAHLQQGIFEQAHINIMAEPNQVCQAYLNKVQTGRLLDTTLGFFEPLKSLNFDYSVGSLGELDKIFNNIKQQYQLNPDKYPALIAEPAHQATMYLLGFYIGMTCARLTDTPVVWANYQQMYRTLVHANPNAQLVDCIEHSFVMLVESGNDKRFVTPILVVTHGLFGISPPQAATHTLTSTGFFEAFEQNFANKNAHPLQYFPYPTVAPSVEVPKLWQIAIQSASRLVTNNLLQIFDGNALEPQVFALDPVSKKGKIEPLASLGKTSPASLLKNNPSHAPVLVVTHPTLINLPTGQCNAIAIDIAVYPEPKLRLRVVLPYRPATSRAGFAIYPLIVTSRALQSEQTQQQAILTALIAQFYQAATAFVSPLHEGNFWQRYYIEPVNSPKKSPLLQHIDSQQAEKIDLTLLPVVPLATTPEPEIKPTLEPNIEPISQPLIKPVAISQPVEKVADSELMQTAPQTVNPVTSPTTNQFYNQNSAPLVKPISSNPTPTLEKTPEIAPAKTQISPELLAQLQRDQQRLQNQLSTSDGDKDRKIVMVVGAAIIVLVLLLLGVWAMK